MIDIARETIEITSDVAHLPNIRRFLRDYSARLTDSVLDEDSLAQLELAVNEAAANVMKHAYQGKTEEPVRVEISSDSQQLTICLLHRGTSFVRDDVPPPSFDGTRDNGFGVYLIEHCVDSVHYGENAEGEKYVRMSKQFESGM